MLLRTLQVISLLAIGSVQIASAQVDLSSNVFQLAINQPLPRRAPQSPSADGYLNERELLRTNLVLGSQGSDGFRGDALLTLQLSPSQRQPRKPAGLFTGVVQGKSLYDQANFRGECAEPSLLADLQCCEQPRGWQIGGGGLFSYGCRKWASRLVIHCGSSFKPPRDSFEGERCVGLLFQFDLGKRKPVR